MTQGESGTRLGRARWQYKQCQGDCNRRYPCKMVGGDYIEGENVGRKVLWGWYIILGVSCGIVLGGISARWCGET